MTTIAEARGRLERMLANDVMLPALSATEVTDLLRMSAVADRYGVPSSYRYPEWTAATAYAAGATVRKAGDPAGMYFVAGDAGISGASQPTWPAAGATVVENAGPNSITWTAYIDSWEPTYELTRGASEGWLQRAGKLAGQYDFSQAEAQSHHKSQKYDHCMAQHRMYRSRIVGTVPIAVADPYAVGVLS